MTALPTARAGHEPSPAVSAVPVTIANATLLHDELVSAVYQYRSDLRYPPPHDSVERRLAWIEKIIARIQQETLP